MQDIQSVREHALDIYLDTCRCAARAVPRSTHGTSHQKAPNSAFVLLLWAEEQKSRPSFPKLCRERSEEDASATPGESACHFWTPPSELHGTRASAPAFGSSSSSWHARKVLGQTGSHMDVVGRDFCLAAGIVRGHERSSCARPRPACQAQSGLGDLRRRLKLFNSCTARMFRHLLRTSPDALWRHHF